MVKDRMGLTPGATLCSGIQVFVQDLKGIEVDLASEKHELSVFWMIFETQIWPTFLECFLIFLKNDWDEMRPWVFTNHDVPQGKDPLNARFANPIGHCDSQSWKHSGFGRHWGKVRVLLLILLILSIFLFWLCHTFPYFDFDTNIDMAIFFKVVNSESYSFPDRSKASRGVAVVEVRSGVWL